MFGLLGFIGGIFALVWTAVFASVGLALLFVFLIPLIIFGLIFRIGFALAKVAVVLVLLCVAVGVMF